jgi:CelD/BcsL family acetyltransferase involved in cellulose biosynthesis
LSGGFEAYLGRLSSNARQQFRRLLRQVEKEDLAFDVASSADEARAFFDELVRLHQQRWTAAGESGAFASDRIIGFHRAVIASVAAKNPERILLSRLSEQGRPIAVLYGFAAGGKFDFYQSGVAEAGRGKIGSPGMAAHLLTMRELASRRGVETYDFLAGQSTYKDRLATGAGELIRARAFALNAGGVRALTAEVAGRIAERMKRRTRGSAQHTAAASADVSVENS